MGVGDSKLVTVPARKIVQGQIARLPIGVRKKAAVEPSRERRRSMKKGDPMGVVDKIEEPLAFAPVGVPGAAQFEPGAELSIGVGENQFKL